MSRRATFTIGFSVTVLVLSLNAHAATNTRQRLDKYGEDMAQAWTDYGKDNQENSPRDQRITDINQQFKKDLATLEPPPNTTIEKSISALIAAASRVNTLLKFDKMQSDRATYITCCCDVLKREMPLTTDYSAARTTQQAFTILMDSLNSARDSLRILSNDQKATVYQQINSCLTDVIKKATPPERPGSG